MFDKFFKSQKKMKKKKSLKKRGKSKIKILKEFSNSNLYSHNSNELKRNNSKQRPQIMTQKNNKIKKSYSNEKKKMISSFIFDKNKNNLKRKDSIQKLINYKKKIHLKKKSLLTKSENEKQKDFYYKKIKLDKYFINLCKLNKFEKIIQIFQKPESKFLNFNYLGKNNWSCLHFAVWNQNYYLTRFLLEKGSDPNSKGDNELTPLIVSATNGILSISILLIKYGAEYNCTDVFGNSFLFYAIKMKHFQYAAFFVKIKEVDLNVKNNGGVFIEELCDDITLKELIVKCREVRNFRKVVFEGLEDEEVENSLNQLYAMLN